MGGVGSADAEFDYGGEEEDEEEESDEYDGEQDAMVNREQ